MIDIFEKFKRLWNEYGLEGLAIASICIIIVLYIYNWINNKQGTYSNKNFFKSIKKNNDFGSPPKDSYFNYRQHTVRDSKLELLAKYHLEDIYQLPFWKIRPDFLKNPKTGHNLEIDLFNREVGLGVEVQGIQHYKFTPRYHLSEDQFRSQKDRDNMKLSKCQQMGIKIIEVPYHIKERDLRNFLIKRLREERLLPLF